MASGFQSTSWTENSSLIKRLLCRKCSSFEIQNSVTIARLKRIIIKASSWNGHQVKLSSGFSAALKPCIKCKRVYIRYLGVVVKRDAIERARALERWSSVDMKLARRFGNLIRHTRAPSALEYLRPPSPLRSTSTTHFNKTPGVDGVASLYCWEKKKSPGC